MNHHHCDTNNERIHSNPSVEMVSKLPASKSAFCMKKLVKNIRDRKEQ